MPKPTQENYAPSHPEVALVEFAPGDFSSSLKSVKVFKAGQTIAVLNGLTKGPKAYTSVQCGRGPCDHVELNSDLVYVNHSCEPNVAFDLSSSNRAEWCLRALKDIQPNDSLTFFYPSTEWDMDQSFRCQCGTTSCLGTIQGAKYLTRNELEKRKFVSPWIIDLVSERDGESIEKVVSQL